MFLSERLPFPLNDGGNLRSYHILKGLAREHEVHLVAHHRSGNHADAIGALSELCQVTTVPAAGKLRQLVAAGFWGTVSSQSLFVAKNWSRNLLAAADGLLGKYEFDAIHFNHLDAACYSLARQWPQRQVFDTHNCLSTMATELAKDSKTAWRRLLFGREAKRLRNTERDVCGKMDAVLVCSQEEADAFQSLMGSGRVVVAPNGVDCLRFRPRKNESEEPGSIVFVGSMGYFPNEDAAIYLCNEVLPKLRGLSPAPKVYLVGKDPSPRVLQLHDGQRVIVTGAVEDVRPYLEKAALVVVPLRHGAGTRLKILEAFAMGKTVISTHKGAEGIPAADGTEILLASDPDGLAAHIISIWNSPELRCKIGCAAATLAKTRFDWARVQDVVLDTYRAFHQRNTSTI